MKKIHNYEQFLQQLREDQEETISAEEVANHIEKLTPDKHDLPHHFIDLVLKSKKTFVKKSMPIDEILKMDPDAAEHVKMGKSRYGQDDSASYYKPADKELYDPIVILDGNVIDGWSRLTTLVKNGEKNVNVYISR